MMDKKQTLEMIAAISNANGAPGFEDDVVAAILPYATDLQGGAALLGGHEVGGLAGGEAVKRGPMLRHVDARMITNPRYQRYALDLAAQLNIPVQEAVRSAGSTLSSLAGDSPPASSASPRPVFPRLLFTDSQPHRL